MQNGVLLLAALKINGAILQFVDKELQTEDVVLAAATQNGLALEFTTLEFKSQEKVAMAAVGNNGLALLWAAGDLKENEEVVKKAIGNKGWVLFWANIKFLLDGKIVLQAVQNDGSVLLALELRDPENALLNDRAFMLEALQKNSSAIDFAPERAQKDPEVKELLDRTAARTRATQTDSEHKDFATESKERATETNA